MGQAAPRRGPSRSIALLNSPLVLIPFCARPAVARSSVTGENAARHSERQYKGNPKTQPENTDSEGERKRFLGVSALAAAQDIVIDCGGGDEGRTSENVGNVGTSLENAGKTLENVGNCRKNHWET